MVDNAPSVSTRVAREIEINKAFSPHAPINSAELFRGRLDQIRETTDAIFTTGLSVMLYGERGVGKTSLASTLSDFLSDTIIAAPKVNCGISDCFEAVIRRSIGALGLQTSRRTAGFNASLEAMPLNLTNFLPEEDLSPDTAAEVLSQLPPGVVLIIDEFDRLPRSAAQEFADLVKGLSDRGASTTVILVGVAENINDLLDAHASVERCLRQIRIPRMSETEIREIIDKGLERAGYSIERTARQHITQVVQGFPHYAHLLGQNAARAALAADIAATEVRDSHVKAGMIEAVTRADQSHQSAYFRAATGTKKANLWREVVAACALAEADERGYFSSRAVQDSLSKILKRPVIQQTVAFHLGKLIEDSRGPLLERTGPERRYRYRFVNPLMLPFVLMKATADGLVL